MEKNTQLNKRMKRKTYKNLLGFLYLGCLIAYYLWILFLISSGSEAGYWCIEGKDILYIPVRGFLFAATVTLLVWIFLRIITKIEPLTDKERESPLLQRFTCLQLFAFTGTLTAMLVFSLPYVTRDGFPSNETLCKTVPIILLFVLHFVIAALSALLLYAGTRTRSTFLSLMCLPALVVVFAGDYIGISFLVNDYCQQDEVVRTNKTGTEVPSIDKVWTEQVGGSVVRYFKQCGWGEGRDSSEINNGPIPFTEKLLYNYANLRQSGVDEDRTLEDYDLFTGEDFTNIQKLVIEIFDAKDAILTEEEAYELISGKILPEVLKTLDYGNLYRSSGLGQLIDMLDYAYYDLGCPKEEKLSLLYDNMAEQHIGWDNFVGLIPYFNQPHAMMHIDMRNYELVWAYSFWARRWSEHSMSLCRRLLDDILKVYPNTAYTPDKMKEIDERCRRTLQQKQVQSKDKLLAEIKSSFTDVPRPERDNIVMSSDDSKRAETGDNYARYEWANVPQNLLREKQDALHYFTVEAFHYYLPAFLTSIVEDYRAGDDMNNTLVWILTYHLKNPEVQDMQYLRFGVLSNEQNEAIYHVLEWLQAEHGDDFINPSDNSSDLQRAINSRWVRYEPLYNTLIITVTPFDTSAKDSENHQQE
ncbi:DUF6714 family protein [uncultured Bacteroides sp.]|uniref:DUF6714 family protein n=1 Tax=uncultured Bacteroides sp. TaxID=162156 RepID=UPI0025F96F76|nr:DUF6714 family protein [uncultured Bacteroides sp.]